MERAFVTVLCLFLFSTLSACQKEYIEWGEKTNSNAVELLEDHNISYEIRDGIIYIPEDDFDKAIYCCS